MPQQLVAVAPRNDRGSLVQLQEETQSQKSCMLNEVCVGIMFYPSVRERRDDQFARVSQQENRHENTSRKLWFFYI